MANIGSSAAQMEFSQDKILHLIEEYHARPILWDVTNEYYRVSSKKNNAWSEIASIFNADVQVIRKKINSLLASFRRERQHVQYRDTDGGIEEVYFSKWYAFTKLSFLLDAYRPNKKNTISLKFEPKDLTDESEDATESPTHPEKKLRTASPDRIDIFNEDVTKIQHINQHHPSELFGPDEFEHFGKHVASQLRQLPLKHSLLLQEKIQSLITRERIAYMDNDPLHS